MATIELQGGQSLTVPKVLVYEKGFRKGDELSEENIEELAFENELFLCEMKALDYLARRLHSKSELRRKLYQKRFSKPVIDSIMEKLTDLRYLDDRKYAELLINESLNLRHDGTGKIRERLMAKGIPREIAEHALLFTEARSFEEENISIIGQKKLASLQRRFSDNRTIYQKLTAYLISKGFSFDSVKQFIRNEDQGAELED
ncbi:MAG: hypothetical protein B6D45_06210 [Ignavibacteriales bacterium UTCHB3]|nr:MAG: hypothetical protein B6D45_06210 [Ignavibacteriales bacterium UTCHB3]